MIIIILLYILSYLLGSLSFGMIIAKIANIGDIQQMGSKNIGATNVTRVAGKKLGALTLVLDCAKCLIIPIAIYFMNFDAPIFTTQIWCVLLAVIGHMFPAWLKFKGGKGVASFFALSLMLSPWIFGVAALLWVLVFKIYRYSSLASLVSVSLVLVTTLAMFKIDIIIPVTIASCLVFIRHQTNIQHLISGTENKFSKVKR